MKILITIFRKWLLRVAGAVSAKAFGKNHLITAFLRATAVPTGTAEARISYGNSVCLSVCPSVCLSRPGGIPSPGKIETPGLHRMIS